jgi:hypothetical protein
MMLHEQGGTMPEVKTIGSSGQISLGKEFAGRHVLVDEVERGVWVVKLGDFVPDTEKWLHERPASEILDRAVAWAENTPPRASDPGKLRRRR